MEYVNISKTNRKVVNNFINERWLTMEMIIRGRIVDMTKVDGIVVKEEGEIIGLLTYEIKDTTLEIISLDSLVEGKGIGTNLINCVKKIARKSGCKRIILITTNDNINAIRFYQKRGFDMVHFYHNAIDISRQIKPEIPLLGENGIPLKHEIEFELRVI